MASDFTWSPSYSFDLTKTPKLLEAPFGDGYSQRSADGINNTKQMWNLTFNKESSIIDDIESFLDTKMGTGLSFTFTPPRKTEIRVICRSIKRSEPSYNTSSLVVTFEQVFGE